MDRYYVMRDGTVLTSFLDADDGLCRAAAADLWGCSWDMGCADVLLALIPAYVADELDMQALDALAEQGVYTVWCRDGQVQCNTDRLTISLP